MSQSWSWIVVRSSTACFDDTAPASVRPRDLAVLALGAVYVERFSECFTGNIARAGNAGWQQYRPRGIRKHTVLPYLPHRDADRCRGAPGEPVNASRKGDSAETS